MTSNILFVLFIINLITNKNCESDVEGFDNYNEFLNFGEKKLHDLNNANNTSNELKNKIDVLGDVLKNYTNAIKNFTKLDIIFLIDASSSVGENNFKNELKFVKKLLSDVIVDYNHTRVALVTFSSPNNVYTNIDQIGRASQNYNKCILLTKQLKKIKYKGGETFTLGALEKAKEIFYSSNRTDSKKVIFLITDGYSNGGDPVPLANKIKHDSIVIFTIGIKNGNYKELFDISSTPGQYYSYLLDSYNEFEGLARRALHSDLKHGDYIPLGYNHACNDLCKEKEDCCDDKAMCTCGTTTGHYACVCNPGYYGNGLKNNCFPCSSGTYADGPNVCLPCPDPFHITGPAAYGIDSCICKEGYKATANRECKELKCEKVAAPENGYYVKNRMCPNVIYSACGIRCEVGYNLIGTSVRLCQKNGTWSGVEPNCEIKTCNQLDVPKGSRMECLQPDTKVTYSLNATKLPVDTVCKFYCNEGYTLTGSKERICLPIARWAGLRTACRPIKCKKVVPLNFGDIEPPSCKIGKQEYGKVCRVVCNRGFELNGQAEKRCIGEKGNWDNKFEETTCIDITPPNITCPNNITANSLPGKMYGHVYWDDPLVSDNSNLSVSVWMKPAIVDIQSSKFEISATTVSYFAQDTFLNTANCSFNIVIKDLERPSIENCVDPPIFLTTDTNGANITWDEPTAFDNSQNVTITKSHEFGFFPRGTTTVTYIATDLSNNTDVCRLNVTVEVSKCEPLPDPFNGQSQCLNLNEGIQCQITCDEGYSIPITQVVEKENDSLFVCNDVDPVWYSQNGFLFPECSATQIPEEIYSGEVTLSQDGNCANFQSTETAKNDVIHYLRNELCIDNCTMDTRVECYNEIEKAKDNARISKREALNSTRSLRHKKYKKVNVKFQLKRKQNNSVYSLTKSRLHLKSGRDASLHYKIKIICPPGYTKRAKRCVKCPKGTFHNETKGVCQNCPFGQYNDKTGQLACSSCPLHYSTGKMRSKRLKDCKEQCPPGSHARTKIQTVYKHFHNITIEKITLKPFCTSCDIGNFQANYGEVKCISCPIGYTTTSVGSTSIEQCVPTSEEICKSNVCKHGQCVIINHYQYSCDCFDNYIGTQCEKQMDLCDTQPCYNDGICYFNNQDFICLCKEGFTGTYCEEVIEKFNKTCLNNGICYAEDDGGAKCYCPPGVTGESCEVKINGCEENYCENNAECVDNDGQFSCKCTGGFIGLRCHLLPCDYRPCSKAKVCLNIPEENATRDSYSCECPEGYVGENCDEKMNYCLNATCLNNATCNNELTNYTCTCPRLYFGVQCEFKKNAKYALNFNQYSTNTYIKLKPFRENLTEISTCLWIQTLDEVNYGTIISYATTNYDNAFTITDYTGLVLYINNKYVVTDIYLNDGMWHHLCITWTNFNGTYQVFVDGKLKKRGFNLSTEKYIEGTGSMVLGQDQDTPGGGFSQSESFVGKLTYVDVWSRYLTYEEILFHFNDCKDSFFGNLYAWPIMQDFIQGGVQIEHSTFCKDCNAPKHLYNGDIEVVNNIAHYSCNPGFSLNNPDYLDGRKCTKASNWEGKFEPYCRRMYCGYPASIRNGYTLGNKYFYQDKLLFKCYEGYTMIGNSTLTCNEDGKWFPDKPRCVGSQQCTAFQKPDFSNLIIISEQSYEDYKENHTKYDIGIQIEFVCNENYEILGNSTLTCLENGTWNFLPPKCMSTTTIKPVKSGCSIEQVPKPPTNGYININPTVANGSASVVEYKCNVGYKLIGDNISSCIIDGYWTEPNTSCQPIVCSVTPKFKNMILGDSQKSILKTYNIGYVMRFKCEDGYDKLGANLNIRCLAVGKWSHIQGKCLRKSCGKPDISDDSEIEGRSYLYGDKVKITCSSGSTYVLLCSKDGLWDGEKDETC